MNMDVWIRNISMQVQEHPTLGYQYIPMHVFEDGTQADQFGMRNVKEALQDETVEVVAVGDSYIEAASRVFYDQFDRQGAKFHALGIFGYGPANYNIVMKEFGAKLQPKVYVYSTYLGNDPGDVRRFESWRASGKGWYEYNGGYVFPIERQGLAWGWRLFLGRAKGFARNLVSRIGPDSAAALRSMVRQDEAETIFQYVAGAKEIADQQHAELVVTIVPRTAHDKPILDPIAAKLTSLCTAKGITCLDLDPSFGDVSTRGRLFAPDEHWNDAGIEVVWKYLWDEKLHTLLGGERVAR
jgi:hypothetical protein